MTTAAFSLLHNSADEREKWLSRFYEIGKEAVRPRTKPGELYGLRVKIDDNFPGLLAILDRAQVQHGFPQGEKQTAVKYTTFNYSTYTYPSQSIIIPLAQPYASFAKAILESQQYPDLRNEKGEPIPPYDVTAHSLSLLMDLSVQEIHAPFTPKWIKNIRLDQAISDCQLGMLPKIGIYRAYVPSMDEGWSRWIFDDAPCMEHESVVSPEVRSGNLNQKKPPFGLMAPKMIEAGKLDPKYKTIIFPDQAPNQILNGYAKGAMPDEYVGGVGKEGVENLKKFVEAGGTLVFLNKASDFAIEQFGLPIKDVTQGLARKDFYIPGSILRTELDTTHPIAKGMPAESIAWFEGGPAFEIAQDARVRIIARYPSDPAKILLSGWALGAEKIAGKAALVEVTMGKGKIILFGFRPQYRGQSLATFPLFFTAISQ